jgi:protease II
LLDAHQPELPPVCVSPRRHGHEYFVEHWRGRLLLLTNGGVAGADYRLMTLGLEGVYEQQQQQQQQQQLQLQQQQPPKLQELLVHADESRGGEAGDGGWRLLVPEREGVCITDLDVFEGAAVLHEMRDARPRLSLVRLKEGLGAGWGSGGAGGEGGSDEVTVEEVRREGRLEIMWRRLSAGSARVRCVISLCCS